MEYTETHTYQDRGSSPQPNSSSHRLQLCKSLLGCPVSDNTPGPGAEPSQREFSPDDVSGVAIDSDTRPLPLALLQPIPLQRILLQ